MLFAFALGCANGAYPELPDCERGELSFDSAPVSLDEVWAVLDAFNPTQVNWLKSSTEAVSSASIAKVAGTGSPGSVAYEDGCPRTGTALFVPVRFTVMVGDGDVAATIEDGVEAFGPSAVDVVFPNDLRAEAELSEDWISAALTDPAGMPVDPEDWTVSLYGSLESAELGVNGHAENSIGNYWQGLLE